MSEWYQLPGDEVVAQLNSDEQRGLTGGRSCSAPGKIWAQRTGRARHEKPLEDLVGAVYRDHGGHPDHCGGHFGLFRRSEGRGRHRRHRDPERRPGFSPGIPGRTGHGGAEEAGGADGAGAPGRPRAEISARELVPGDIVLLEAGNLVPADARLLESVNLRVQEAALTGESEPVEKVRRAQSPGATCRLGDRRNMVYMGTVVDYGRGDGDDHRYRHEHRTGPHRRPDPDRRAGADPAAAAAGPVGQRLGLAALGLVAVVFVLGLLRGEDLRCCS